MNDLYIDNLSGDEFENYLKKLFENLGYSVEHTPASSDYGADLVVSKDDEKIVVQAKRYSGTVGISSVQEVIGAKNYYLANKCLVVTNNYFTPNAIELAIHNNVELWNRDVLIKMAVLSVNPKFRIEEVSEPQMQKSSSLDYPEDELLTEAVSLVVNEQMASISLLQRRLKVSYSRAAVIMDQLEERAIVGGYNGGSPRKVLVMPEDLIENDYAIGTKPRKAPISLGYSHNQTRPSTNKLNYLNLFNFNINRFIRSRFIRLILFPVTISYYMIKICLFFSINIIIFIINILIK